MFLYKYTFLYNLSFWFSHFWPTLTYFQPQEVSVTGMSIFGLDPNEDINFLQMYITVVGGGGGDAAADAAM